MKQRLKLFRRAWGIYYWVDSETGRQGSLRTRDRTEAERLLQTMRESVRVPDQVNLAMAQLHLQAASPDLGTRTWSDLFSEWIQQGIAQSTRERRMRTVARPWMRQLGRHRLTDPEAGEWILEHLKGNYAKEVIRSLQRLGISLGWMISAPVPDIHLKVRKRDRKVTRAITFKEHQAICAFERDSFGRPNAKLGSERADYYQMLWYTGAAQTDAANLQSDNVNWDQMRLVFRRQKTGEKCILGISEELEPFLERLPSKGYLFPRMAALTSGHRSAEFCRRRKLLEFDGISLHSYRYAWAERAAVVGMPLRWAQAALGHSSRAVALAYARKAEIACPLPEAYQDGPELLNGGRSAVA